MEKEFVPYEQALALKQLGFDEPCLMYWNDFGKTSINRFQLYNKIDEWCQNYIEAPLYQQAFRWFRENYNLISSIDTIIYGCTLNEQEFHYKIITNTGFGSYGQFGTYEEAEFACLEKLIEIVESKLK
jgi:hypothetical protein